MDTPPEPPEGIKEPERRAYQELLELMEAFILEMEARERMEGVNVQDRK
jgi:hypothetical protein